MEWGRFCSPKVWEMSRENTVCPWHNGLSPLSPYFSLPGACHLGSIPKLKWNLCHYLQSTTSWRSNNHMPFLDYLHLDHIILLLQGLHPNPSLVLTVLFWEAMGQAGPGWVRGSVLSLTSSVTPDRPFNLSETYFPYLRVTELLCASTKVSTKHFVQCKVPFWW